MRVTWCLSHSLAISVSACLVLLTHRHSRARAPAPHRFLASIGWTPRRLSLSQLLWAPPPGSLLRPLIDPVVHGFVPELRILRLLNPVAFVGGIQHFRRDAFHLQRGEKLQAF